MLVLECFQAVCKQSLLRLTEAAITHRYWKVAMCVLATCVMFSAAVLPVVRHIRSGITGCYCFVHV